MAANTSANRFSQWVKHPLFWLGCITALAIWLRWPLMFQDVNYFENWTLKRMQGHATIGWAIANGDYSFIKQGFYYWWMKQLTGWFGSDILPMRAVSLAFGLGTICMAYITGKEVFNKRVGVTFSLMTAIGAAAIIVSTIGRSYSALYFLSIFSGVLFWRWCIREEKSRANLFGFAIAAATGLYVHLSILILLAPLFLIWALKTVATRDRVLMVRGFAVSSLTCLLYSPMIPYSLLGVQTAKGHASGAGLNYERFSQLVGFNLGHEIPVAAVVFALLAIFLFLNRQQKELKVVAAMAALAGITISFALFLSVYVPRFKDTINVKYVLALVPMVHLVIAKELDLVMLSCRNTMRYVLRQLDL